MAGDWIKMRVDLSDDPAVIAISAKIGVDEDSVVGKLHRLWSWADRHTINGSTDGIRSVWIDRYVSCKGFAEALIDAGWLTETESGIAFPGFEKHNGESAKKRADAQARQRLSRAERREGVTGLSRDCIPRPFIRSVYSRDEHTCVYCGAQSSENEEGSKKTAKLSVDHITPASRGGITAVENLATCCRLCNSEKNDRTCDEWGLWPSFLSDGVTYENGHIVVTRTSDEKTTKAQPEKSRVEKSKEPPPPTMSAPAINDQRSTIGAEWVVVVVDLEKLGMDNPEGVCRASDWSPAAAKALVDHFINHREAEGWGVGLLRSKLLAVPLQDRPDKILTLKKSGKPVKSEHGDPADPVARWISMDSASQDRWRMELLARHQQAIEGLGPEGRMALLPGENLAALRRILAVSEPRWSSSAEVAVRLLLEMERRGAAER